MRLLKDNTNKHMKILFSLFALLLFTESCNSAKTAATDSKASFVTSESKTVDFKDKGDTLKKYANKTTITYKALSRGLFVFVKITPSEVLVSSDRNLINIDKYSCEAKDWDALNVLLEELNFKTFESLEAPTEKRLFDGAAHATLTLTKDGEEITTPSFDHGSPPVTIEALVNKVLSIKENAIKH